MVLKRSYITRETLQQCDTLSVSSQTQKTDTVENEDSNEDLSQQLLVYSFNILAHGLTFDTFTRPTPEVMEYQHRLTGILQEITEYSADVICLQEVDDFSTIKSALASEGYDGVWEPKPHSTCLKFDGNIGPDGSAIFYKTGKLKLLEKHQFPLMINGKTQNQVLIACELETMAKYKILVVCLHLKAKDGFEAQRAAQGQSVLKFIEQKADERTLDAVIVAGDMNADPEESVHSYMKQAGFTNSYHEVMQAYPDYTTCKFREGAVAEDLKKRAIDYIYYKNMRKSILLPQKVLAIPDEKDLGEDKLPSMEHPSDHISIATAFKLL